ncbi:MAG: hypothetical protein R3E77_06280 [Steroidobacteraceae bacterium]
MERSLLALGLLTSGSDVPANQRDRLVFVCTGNICRSPYASAIAQRAGINAVSCGIATTPGLPADPMAIDAARRRGIDLATHRTSAFAASALRATDWVIPIEMRHALHVRGAARQAGCAVTILSALHAGQFSVVSDPYGTNAAEFDRVYHLIDTLCARLFSICRG